MAAPTITSINPSSGGSGTLALIVGTEFTGTTGVTINGNAVTMFGVADDSNVLVVIPAGTGTGDVVLTNATGPDTLTDGWTYQTGIFCTIAEVLRKAGTNASSVSSADAYVNDYTTQAESVINVRTKKNWSDDYTTLDVDVKGILKEACSNLAAIYVIQFDMSTFESRGEAESMITILRDAFLRDLQLLSDINKQKFMDNV